MDAEWCAERDDGLGLKLAVVGVRGGAVDLETGGAIKTRDK
jgi:hypothetical protein